MIEMIVFNTKVIIDNGKWICKDDKKLEELLSDIKEDTYCYGVSGGYFPMVDLKLAVIAEKMWGGE
jgi:hypothetical protein